MPLHFASSSRCVFKYTNTHQPGEDVCDGRGAGAAGRRPREAAPLHLRDAAFEEPEVAAADGGGRDAVHAAAQGGQRARQVQAQRGGYGLGAVIEDLEDEMEL